MSIKEVLKVPTAIADITRRLRSRLHARLSGRIPSPTTQRVLQLYYAMRDMWCSYPADEGTLQRSGLYNSWWYYTVELLPHVFVRGIYPDTLPLLPRILLRKCTLSGQTCLDVGTMEGLIPAVMSRQGARRVLAVDANYHCYSKMSALRHYYRVHFEFRTVGLMYNLGHKLARHAGSGFDLINVSGLLYHVFSPMHVLAGLRPLLRKNGLMIVGTNIVEHQDFSMHFNRFGHLQAEQNTFWYMSIPMFEYMVRYFKLLPIDCLYLPYTSADTVHYVPDVSCGYLCVVCRAADDSALPDDPWTLGSRAHSWEYQHLCDEKMLNRWGVSQIQYHQDSDPRWLRRDGRSIDLLAAVRAKPPCLRVSRSCDSNTLSLNDNS